jgi:predicted AAA+ superfamily ATPase
VATAHKIAQTEYHLLTTGEAYQEESAAEYDRKRREREIKHLARRAQKLGYTLTVVPATASEARPEPGGQGSF